MIELFENISLVENLSRIAGALLIILITFITAKAVKKALNIYFKKSSRVLHTAVTRYKFLVHTMTGMIYVIGFGIAIYMIPFLKTLSLSIFAGAGVLAVVIGFASQQAFANIVSGVFITIFKPFRIGDRVKIREDLMGVVEDITLRHTVIKNYENRRIVVPNSLMGSEIIENSDILDQKICKFLDIGISYDSDVDKAMKIIKQEAIKHPNFIDNRTEEDKKNKEDPVPVRIIGFGDSSVNLRAWIWSPDPFKAFALGCDLRKSIKKIFEKEGIEIPFPYRTIVYKDKRKR